MHPMFLQYVTAFFAERFNSYFIFCFIQFCFSTNIFVAKRTVKSTLTVPIYC